MIWKVKDHNRWRKRFAFFPMVIGERWIWLSSYSWRNATKEIRGLLSCDKLYYEIWKLSDGYTVWRSLDLSNRFVLTCWVTPSNKTDKP